MQQQSGSLFNIGGAGNEGSLFPSSSTSAGDSAVRIGSLFSAATSGGGGGGILFSGATSGGGGGGSLFSAATSGGGGGGSLFSAATSGGGGSLFSSATAGSSGSGAGLFSFSSTGGGGLFAGQSQQQSGGAGGGSPFIPDLEASNEAENDEEAAGQDQKDNDDDLAEEADNDEEEGSSTRSVTEDGEDVDNDGEDNDNEDENEENNDEDDDEEGTQESDGNSASDERPIVENEPRRLALKRFGGDVEDESRGNGDKDPSDFVGNLRQRIKVSRQSIEDNAQKVQQQQPASLAIVLRNVPDDLKADEPIRRLFQGVTRVYASRAKSQAILHFANSAAADAAMTAAASARMRARYPGIEAFRRRLPGGNGGDADIAAPAPTSSSVSSVSLPASQSLADRIRVLESVERQLRARLGKYSSTAVPSTAAATCQDMCPEKERYLREDRHRVHAFESAAGRPGVMDHLRAVKEYSRSAADQEAPLPHELRPLPVLNRTMLYLSTCIADIGEQEGRWQEWYEFLWDRTRAIRKEVTQQRLCNPGAAELVERCARFHIYASARMVGMPADVFDEKINNENLTKCLQTLRELYGDLAGQCPNESEFRAYMILMKLNEPNVLDEVHQLSSEIRASPQVRLALRAFFALSSNNYVAFFRSVDQADFLTACLLLRYFTQARIGALRTMSHALRPPANVRRLRLPLARLPLGFEDAEDAASFCRFMGFECDDGNEDEEPAVWLDRSVANSFHPTESRSVRAVRVVESKRGSRLVGECLWGGQLPPLRLPQPSVSFDERGRYIGDLAVSREATPPPASPSPSPPPPPPPQPRRIPQQPTAPLTVVSTSVPTIASASSLFQSSSATASAFSQSLFSQPVSAASMSLFPSQPPRLPAPEPPVIDDRLFNYLAEELISSLLPPLVRSVVTDYIDSVRAISGAVADAYAETFNSLTRQLCAEIASDFLTESSVNQTAINNATDSIISDVIGEGVRSECETVLIHRLIESLDTVLLDALIFEETELSCRQYLARLRTRRTLDANLLYEHRRHRLAVIWDSWRRRAVAKAASRARLSDMAPCAPLVDPFQLVDRLHGRLPPDTSVAHLPRAAVDPTPAAAAALAAAAAVLTPVRLPEACRLVLLLSSNCPAFAANWLRRKLASSLVADSAEAAEATGATHCLAEASMLHSEARLSLLHLPTLVFACHSANVATASFCIRLLGGRPNPIWHRDLLLGLRWLLNQPTLPQAASRLAPDTPSLASVVESLLLNAYFRPVDDLANRCDAACQPQPPIRCLVQFYNACIVALGPLASPSAIAELRLPDAPQQPPERVTSAWRLNQEAIAWLLSAYPPACPLAGATAAMSSGRPVRLFPWARLAARLANRRLSDRLTSSDWSRAAPGPAKTISCPGLVRLDIDDFLPDDFYQQWSRGESPPSAQPSDNVQRLVVWRPPPPPPPPPIAELAMALEKLRDRLREAQAESRITARMLSESF